MALRMASTQATLWATAASSMGQVRVSRGFPLTPAKPASATLLAFSMAASGLSKRAPPV